jgi:opacity protein-like surface antigen
MNSDGTCRSATKLRMLLGALAVLSGISFAEAPQTQAAGATNGFEYILTPYGWLATLDGTIGIGGHSADVEVPMLDYLDMGAMLMLEVRKNRWGVVLDGLYVDLSDASGTPGPFFESVKVEYQQAALDVGLCYRVFESESGWVDLLAGARYMYYSAELGFTPNDEAASTLSAQVIDSTVAAVHETVEGKVGANADDIAEAVAGRLGDIASAADARLDEIADAVREAIGEKLPVKIDPRTVNAVAQQGGRRLSEGLDGRNPSTGSDLADAVMGAFEGRIDDKIGSRASGIRIESEAARLAAAMRSAVADQAGARIEGPSSTLGQDIARIEAGAGTIQEKAQAKTAAIRDAVSTAVKAAASAAVSDLKTTASAETKKALDKAEKQLTASLTAAMDATANAEVSKSLEWVDPYVGLRARWLATDRFYVGLRGDVGGFGIGSASDLAWQLFGGVGYAFNPTVSMELGWRYLDMDYDHGDFLLDAGYSGATVGLAITL